MAKARSRSKAEQTSAGAGTHTTESREFDSDIHSAEAYRFNMKRMVDDYAQFAARNHVDSNDMKNRFAEIAATDYAARLTDERALTKSFYGTLSNAMNNLVDEEKRVMAQETRHHDIAADRQWNVDEQGYQVVQALRELGAKGVLNDATLATVVRALVKEK